MSSVRIISRVLNDLGPDITGTLKDNAGVAINIAGYTFTFVVERASDPFTISGSIVLASAGTFKFELDANSTDEPGDFPARFKIDPGTAKIFHIPNIEPTNLRFVVAEK